MPKKKGSKRSGSRLPPAGLGLVTLLDEETGGLKIKPELVIVGALVFIVASIAGLFFFPT